MYRYRVHVIIDADDASHSSRTLTVSFDHATPCTNAEIRNQAYEIASRHFEMDGIQPRFDLETVEVTCDEHATQREHFAMQPLDDTTTLPSDIAALRQLFEPTRLSMLGEMPKLDQKSYREIDGRVYDQVKLVDLYARLDALHDAVTATRSALNEIDSGMGYWPEKYREAIANDVVPAGTHTTEANTDSKDNRTVVATLAYFMRSRRGHYMRRVDEGTATKADITAIDAWTTVLRELSYPRACFYDEIARAEALRDARDAWVAFLGAAGVDDPESHRDEIAPY